MTIDATARKPRVAILEDESSMCALLQRILVAEYTVIMMASGSQLMEAIKHAQVDVALLDIVLSGENGIEIAKSIRARSEIPIVMLSGLSASETVVAGLAIGANDYVTKPFDPEILKARISNVLRNRPVEDRKNAMPGPFLIQGCTVDPWKRTIENTKGKSIRVTEMEIQLLTMVSKKSPNVVSRDELSRSLVGKKWQPEVRALDVHISHLRTKLKKVGFQDHQIICHRGVGYSIRIGAEKS